MTDEEARANARRLRDLMEEETKIPFITLIAKQMGFVVFEISEAELLHEQLHGSASWEAYMKLRARIDITKPFHVRIRSLYRTAIFFQHPEGHELPDLPEKELPEKISIDKLSQKLYIEPHAKKGQTK